MSCCVTWRHSAAVNGKVKWYHHSNHGDYNGNALNEGFSFPATKISCLPSKHATFRVNFFYCSTAPVVQGLLIVEVSRSTLRLTTLSRIPLDKWSARCRGLCLTTHNTQKRQTFMASAGFEPAIPASELPKTYALECAATGTGKTAYLNFEIRKL